VTRWRNLRVEATRNAVVVYPFLTNSLPFTVFVAAGREVQRRTTPSREARQAVRPADVCEPVGMTTERVVARQEDGEVAYPIGKKGVVLGRGGRYDAAVGNVEPAIGFISRRLGRNRWYRMARCWRRFAPRLVWLNGFAQLRSFPLMRRRGAWRLRCSCLW